MLLYWPPYYIIPIWRLTSSRCARNWKRLLGRQKELKEASSKTEVTVFCNLIMDVTSLRICHIPLVRSKTGSQTHTQKKALTQGCAFHFSSFSQENSLRACPHIARCMDISPRRRLSIVSPRGKKPLDRDRTVCLLWGGSLTSLAESFLIMWGGH